MAGDKLPIIGEDSPEEDRGESRKPTRTIIVEPIIFIYGLTSLIQYPVFSQYLYYAVGRQYNLTSPNETRAHQCKPFNSSEQQHSDWSTVNQLQQISTSWNIYISLAGSIPSLVVTPFYSALTDKIGRKWTMIAVCSGDLLKLLVNTIAMICNWPLSVFIVTGVISGLSGGMGALFASIFSYLADMTTAKERPFRIALAECLFGLSGILSEVGVGYWLRYQTYFWPYGFAAVMVLVNLLYTIFFVSEIRKRDFNGISGCGQYKRIFSVFTAPNRNTAAMIFGLLGLLFYCAQGFSYTVDQQYELGYPFCWDSVLIGINSAISTVCVDAGMLVGAAVLTRYLGWNPLVVCAIGIVSSGGSKIMKGLAQNTATLMLTSLVGIFSLLPIPMIRAFLSLQVSKDEQGAMFASISFAEVLCSLFGSTVINVIYQKTVAWFPGFVFLVLSVVASIALIFIAIALVFQKTRERRHQELIESVVDVNANAEDKEA